MEEQNTTPQTTDWIKKVQARSWEIELFISGGSLFSLLQIADAFALFAGKLAHVNFTVSSSFSLFSVVIPSLVGGFVLHLVVRGFWVAMVILYRVHPNGIKLERIALAEPFMKQMVSFNLKQSVERLDKVCSLIFATAFVYAMLLFGLAMLAAVALLITFVPLQNPDLFTNIWIWLPMGMISVPFLFGYMLFLYIDLPTFGLLRKNKWIAKVWFPFYQLYNFLTLGFLWRPYLQVITSNIRSRWLIFIWVIVFYVVGLAFALSSQGSKWSLIESLDATSAHLEPVRDSYYQDKNDDNRWTDVTIQSDIITDDFLKIFVPSNKIQSSIEAPARNVFMPTIVLNDSVYQSLKWLSITKNNGQTGLETVIGIKN